MIIVKVVNVNNHFLNQISNVSDTEWFPKFLEGFLKVLSAIWTKGRFQNTHMMR